MMLDPFEEANNIIDENVYRLVGKEVGYALIKMVTLTIEKFIAERRKHEAELAREWTEGLMRAVKMAREEGEKARRCTWCGKDEPPPLDAVLCHCGGKLKVVSEKEFNELADSAERRKF